MKLTPKRLEEIRTHPARHFWPTAVTELIDHIDILEKEIELYQWQPADVRYLRALDEAQDMVVRLELKNKELETEACKLEWQLDTLRKQIQRNEKIYNELINQREELIEMFSKLSKANSDTEFCSLYKEIMLELKRLYL